MKARRHLKDVFKEALSVILEVSEPKGKSISVSFEHFCGTLSDLLTSVF